jgi:hypothetical protein
LKFALAKGTPAGPVLGRLVDRAEGYTLTSVGRNGTLLENIDAKRAYLVTPRGARARVPSLSFRGYVAQGAIASGGRLAFTSKKDGRIHFMTCR